MLNQGVILLVEDDPDAVLLMKKAFSSVGITNPLRAVKDGEELISYLSGEEVDGTRATSAPTMILLDLKLPRKSGFELLEWVRKNAKLSRVIIVVLTSSRENKDIAKAYAMGANSYLVKPTSFHDLVDIVKMLKNYWLTHNQFPGLA